MSCEQSFACVGTVVKIVTVVTALLTMTKCLSVAKSETSMSLDGRVDVGRNNVDDSIDSGSLWYRNLISMTLDGMNLLSRLIFMRRNLMTSN